MEYEIFSVLFFYIIVFVFLHPQHIFVLGKFEFLVENCKLSFEYLILYVWVENCSLTILIN